jgi:hypothetical protein
VHNIYTRNTDYRIWRFSGFAQSLHKYFWDSIAISSRTPPSKSFLIHQSPFHPKLHSLNHEREKYPYDSKPEKWTNKQQSFKRFVGKATILINYLQMRNIRFARMVWVELGLSYGWRSVDQFLLVSGSPFWPMTRFYPYPFSSDNHLVVLPVGRPLWRDDGSVTYSALADWLGHWGPITIHYRHIWDCVPSSSPLTTRRD